ncbi:hypothetical protein SAMN04487768_0398 [Burkholderia sp. b13]|nr:hypothetical protein SAMN04487768_0398 [Burkholderia sp. b13]
MQSFQFSKGAPRCLLSCKLMLTDFGLPSIVAQGLFCGVYKSQHTNADLVRIEALQLDLIARMRSCSHSAM